MDFFIYCRYGWSVWPVICYLKVKVRILINKSFSISSSWSFCCASVIRILLSFFSVIIISHYYLLLSNLCVFSPRNHLYIVCLACWLQVPWFKSILWCLGVPRYDCLHVFSFTFYNKPVMQIMSLISPHFRDDSQFSSDER